MFRKKFKVLCAMGDIVDLEPADFSPIGIVKARTMAHALDEAVDLARKMYGFSEYSLKVEQMARWTRK